MSLLIGKDRRRHYQRALRRAGQWKLAAAESLEDRHLLAGDVLIAELSASNKTGLLDSFAETSLGDTNGDGQLDVADLELLQAGVRDGNSDPLLDTNSDGVVDATDVTSWFSVAGIANVGRPYVSGDADLDGDVDASDLNSLGIHWRADDATWGDGDFTGDGSVTAADLNALAVHWQHGVPAAATVDVERAPCAPLRALRPPRAPLPVTPASSGRVSDFQLESTHGEGGGNSSTGILDENVDDSADNDEINPGDFFTPADPNRGLPIDENPANDDEWMFLELVDDVLALARCPVGTDLARICPSPKTQRRSGFGV